jgi:nicotinamidase-related amidase
MLQFRIWRGAGLASLALAWAAAANAQTIVDAWKTVPTPPPPELQPVTLDGAHTALLILDVNADTCVEAKRPSCARSIPAIKRLLDQARAHHALVVYSGGPPTSTTTVKQPDALTPQPGEPMVRSGVDKFLGTDLDKILGAREIKTVIITGTSSNGAVLYTGSGAALRGLAVVVPVDGASAETPFAELYTAWHLKNAPATISSHVTLTRSDMVTLH